ncbi:LysR substrate-binding domain-containing protein [Ensifer adhaerens]|uniref:LysR substrate-binding domain-containing protein n=1 Tax=Ensifer adhaerens TaxID=106592 RepID=UPI000CF0825B|nr:LysR substrate-binding domain-containing protein [Ensifer adhaerens]
MILGSVEAIKGMVKAGLGCAVLPGMAVADKESQGELVVGPLTPKLSRRLCVIVRQDKRLDIGLRKTLACPQVAVGRGAANQ